MRPATLVELASRHGIELPTADPTELYRYDSLDGFLRVFWLVQSTLMTRDDWARLAYESAGVHGRRGGHRRDLPVDRRHGSCLRAGSRIGAGAAARRASPFTGSWHRAGDRRRDGLDRARDRPVDIPACLRSGSRGPVCPNSNVRIANVFERLEDHVYPQLRASGLLATLNTDDPALSDLDLGIDYRSVAAAFGSAGEPVTDRRRRRDRSSSRRPRRRPVRPATGGRRRTGSRRGRRHHRARRRDGTVARARAEQRAGRPR